MAQEEEEDLGSGRAEKLYAFGRDEPVRRGQCQLCLPGTVLVLNFRIKSII